MTKHDTRDELDRMLQQASRRVRFGDLVPAPAIDQTEAEQEAADEQMLLLLEGELPAQQRPDVEQRLADSAFDANRQAILAEVLQEVEGIEPPSTTNVEGSTFARLVFEVGQSTQRAIRWLRGTDVPIDLAAAAVATRDGSTPDAHIGADHYCRFERRFGDWDAVVEVERVPRHDMALRVRFSKEGTPLQGARARLHRGTKLLESVRIKDGAASFAELPPAQYVIEVKAGEDSIANLTLDFLPS